MPSGIKYRYLFDKILNEALFLICRSQWKKTKEPYVQVHTGDTDDVGCSRRHQP